ncbi:MAG: FxsA family protein [Planctomycetes bacterium]|nr:FxsA family protein [Planctomycetota bacterium]
MASRLVFLLCAFPLLDVGIFWVIVRYLPEAHEDLAANPWIPWLVILAITFLFAFFGGIGIFGKIKEAIKEIAREMASGFPPIPLFIDIVILLIALALVLTPGILSSLFGLKLAQRGSRERIKMAGMQRMMNRAPA